MKGHATTQVRLCLWEGKVVGLDHACGYDVDWGLDPIARKAAENIVYGDGRALFPIFAMLNGITSTRQRELEARWGDVVEVWKGLLREALNL